MLFCLLSCTIDSSSVNKKCNIYIFSWECWQKISCFYCVSFYKKSRSRIVFLIVMFISVPCQSSGIGLLASWFWHQEKKKEQNILENNFPVILLRLFQLNFPILQMSIFPLLNSIIYFYNLMYQTICWVSTVQYYIFY